MLAEVAFRFTQVLLLIATVRLSSSCQLVASDRDYTSHSRAWLHRAAPSTFLLLFRKAHFVHLTSQDQRGCGLCGISSLLGPPSAVDLMLDVPLRL